MKFDLDSWQEILMTITRNKSRSILTAFGVFWGIFMLLALTGGGAGLKQLLQSNFKNFAANSVFFFTNPTQKAYKGYNSGRYWKLKLEDLDRVKAIQGIETAVASSRVSGGVINYKGKKSDSSITGVFPDQQKVSLTELKYGRYINDIDQQQRRKVCIISYKVYQDLFHEGNDPCGNYIECNGNYYKVVGVEKKNADSGVNIGDNSGLTIPINTALQLYNNGNEVDVIAILLAKNANLKEIEGKVRQQIYKAHIIAPDDLKALQSFNAQIMVKMMTSLFDSINWLLIIVGLGTLFAGAIGVSNIMLVTVKERTSEIGIRRAIGATQKTIMQQIITESVVLTSIAGLLGLSFTVLILQLVEVGISSSLGTHTPFQVSFNTAVLALLSLLSIGVLAGLFPAYRAMKIKPVEAMREE